MPYVEEIVNSKLTQGEIPPEFIEKWRILSGAEVCVSQLEGFVSKVFSDQEECCVKPIKILIADTEDIFFDEKISPAILMISKDLITICQNEAELVALLLLVLARKKLFVIEPSLEMNFSIYSQIIWLLRKNGYPSESLVALLKRIPRINVEEVRMCEYAARDLNDQMGPQKDIQPTELLNWDGLSAIKFEPFIARELRERQYQDLNFSGKCTVLLELLELVFKDYDPYFLQRVDALVGAISSLARERKASDSEEGLRKLYGFSEKVALPKLSSDSACYLRERLCRATGLFSEANGFDVYSFKLASSSVVEVRSELDKKISQLMCDFDWRRLVTDFKGVMREFEPIFLAEAADPGQHYPFTNVIYGKIYSFLAGNFFSQEQAQQKEKLRQDVRVLFLGERKAEDNVEPILVKINQEVPLGKIFSHPFVMLIKSKKINLFSLEEIFSLLIVAAPVKSADRDQFNDLIREVFAGANFSLEDWDSCLSFYRAMVEILKLTKQCNAYRGIDAHLVAVFQAGLLLFIKTLDGRECSSSVLFKLCDVVGLNLSSVFAQELQLYINAWFTIDVRNKLYRNKRPIKDLVEDYGRYGTAAGVAKSLFDSFPFYRGEYEDKIKLGLTEIGDINERIYWAEQLLFTREIDSLAEYRVLNGGSFKLCYRAEFPNPQFYYWLVNYYISALKIRNTQLSITESDLIWRQAIENIVSKTEGCIRYTLLSVLLEELDERLELKKLLFVEVNKIEMFERTGLQFSVPFGRFELMGLRQNSCEALWGAFIEFLLLPVQDARLKKLIALFEANQNVLSRISGFGSILNLLGSRGNKVNDNNDVVMTKLYQLHENFWLMPIKQRVYFLDLFCFPPEREEQSVSIAKIENFLLNLWFPGCKNNQTHFWIRAKNYAALAAGLIYVYLGCLSCESDKRYALATLMAVVKPLEFNSPNMALGHHLKMILMAFDKTGQWLLSFIEHSVLPVDIQEGLRLRAGEIEGFQRNPSLPQISDELVREQLKAAITKAFPGLAAESLFKKETGNIAALQIKG